MPYSDEFNDLVNNAGDTYNYIGIGNPNSKILLVGQEAAISQEDVGRFNEHMQNACYWQSLIKKNEEPILEYEIVEGHPLRANWENRTWSKYQVLIDKIFSHETRSFYVDFLKSAFTTEMNETPSERTREAQQRAGFRNQLEQRKNTFFTSDFIQNFPVVVLACSNYINGEEICRLFNVKYIEEISVITGRSTQSFWIHTSTTAKPKLVIHTRQLSGGARASNNLIENLAEIIRKFMTENNLK